MQFGHHCWHIVVSTFDQNGNLVGSLYSKDNFISQVRVQNEFMVVIQLVKLWWHVHMHKTVYMDVYALNILNNISHAKYHFDKFIIRAAALYAFG